MDSGKYSAEFQDETFQHKDLLTATEVETA